MKELQEKYRAQIEELVSACQRVAELNYVTSAGGNLSVRVDDELILITPTKTPKRCIRFDDICMINPAGNVLYAADGRKPTGEWQFHVRIMRKRPDIKAIVHAHPPILTGFAIANNNMLALPWLPETITEVGPLLMVPYETPLTEALSEQFDAVISDSNGFLMENHGALFCSPTSIFDAVELLNMSECMAYSVLVAHLLGNARTIPSEYVKEMDSVISTRNLKIPGATGRFHSASELFRLPEP